MDSSVIVTLGKRRSTGHLRGDGLLAGRRGVLYLAPQPLFGDLRGGFGQAGARPSLHPGRPHGPASTSSPRRTASAGGRGSCRSRGKRALVKPKSRLTILHWRAPRADKPTRRLNLGTLRRTIYQVAASVRSTHWNRYGRRHGDPGPRLDDDQAADPGHLGSVRGVGRAGTTVSSARAGASQYLAEQHLKPDYRINCIIGDKRFRRDGLETVALQGALDLIAQVGGGVVEGYPHIPAAAQPRLLHSIRAADMSAQMIPLLPSGSAITVSPGAPLSSTTVPPAATAPATRCSTTSGAT